MRNYYYSHNEQQLGPFIIDELRGRQIRKSTLVWTDGLHNWVKAEEIEELNDILISEPPPLPRRETIEQVETVRIIETSRPIVNSKYDISYQKETDATVIGILLFLTPFAIQLTRILKFDDMESYTQAKVLSALLTVAVRIGATTWAVNIAKRQNRNITVWGWLTFFLPGISLIIIGQLNKLKLKIELNRTLTKNEQISMLITKANKLFTEKRFQETVEVLNKAIQLDYENSEAVLLRGISLYQIKEYDMAKSDFTFLKQSGLFPDKSNLYLGIIESDEYNYVKAIELWKISEENGSTSAKDYLDRYLYYKGKYLLNQTEINKKLGATIYSQDVMTGGTPIDYGNENIIYLKGIVQADNISQTGKYGTRILLHQYGFCFELCKLFKTHRFAIGYTEINDITYSDATLNFILFDKSILSFQHEREKGHNRKLNLLCNDYIQETGQDPTLLKDKPI